MSDLICEHYDLLLVITRFGIPLGFGDKTIAQVCKENSVHTPTLLAVVNGIANSDHYKQLPPGALAELSAEALTTYLRNSHNYFLEYRLPLLREQLAAATANGSQEIGTLIMHFFDEYHDEVRKHMGYEDKTVFPYVDSLIRGVLPAEDSYHIDIFARRHDKVENKITELKNILIKYYPKGTGYALTAVLHDLFETEEDLSTHTFIENNLFVPLIQELERKLRSQSPKA